MSITEDVKSLAFEAGFDAVGITSAEPFAEAERVLQERLSRGLLEGSGYNPCRIGLYTHPRESLPTARSIISVALSYLTDDIDESEVVPSLTGRIARFARGRDYHKVLREGLDRLSDDIRKKLGRPVEFVMSADTGPLADRPAAIRAGIGSLGKNTCVYAGEYGSWVVLGELLTDLELTPAASEASSVGRRPSAARRREGKAPSAPRNEQAAGKQIADSGESVQDSPSSAPAGEGRGEGLPLRATDDARRPTPCGTCDACLKACPTGALSKPYMLDVKMCLSYLTQSRRFIPHDLREKLGTRIYGCDTCQTACPLNENAKPGNARLFRPSDGLGSGIELLSTLNMSPGEFKERVLPTTAGWIGRTSLRRNAAIALGNIGDPASVPGLVEALSDTSPIIRGYAAWALGRIGTSPARRALETALSWEEDKAAGEEILDALVRGSG